MRTSAIVLQALVHIFATMAVRRQPGARQTVARTIVAARQIEACVLAGTVTVAQATLVDVC